MSVQRLLRSGMSIRSTDIPRKLILGPEKHIDQPGLTSGRLCEQRPRRPSACRLRMVPAAVGLLRHAELLHAGGELLHTECLAELLHAGGGLLPARLRAASRRRRHRGPAIVGVGGKGGKAVWGVCLGSMPPSPAMSFHRRQMDDGKSTRCGKSLAGPLKPAGSRTAFYFTPETRATTRRTVRAVLR